MEKEEAIKQLNVIDARTATEVEILDATGSTRKVFDIVQLLREHGYDVVELRRSANGTLEMSCIVVYNESKKVEAKKIAHLLSIESKRIAVKPDSKAMLDISILLGTDILKSNR
ncbi:MAG: LytR C-terminal domain-containing protein [Bacteroidetes bacterium]|nr:LytR C-terminal domain-containing protein [Bacteroidota bacterium]